jgi:hypothetical protein
MDEFLNWQVPAVADVDMAPLFLFGVSKVFEK